MIISILRPYFSSIVHQQYKDQLILARRLFYNKRNILHSRLVFMWKYSIYFIC